MPNIAQALDEDKQDDQTTEPACVSPLAVIPLPFGWNDRHGLEAPVKLRADAVRNIVMAKWLHDQFSR